MSGTPDLASAARELCQAVKRCSPTGCDHTDEHLVEAQRRCLAALAAHDQQGEPEPMQIRSSTSPLCACSHEHRHHDAISGCSWLGCDCEHYNEAPAAHEGQQGEPEPVRCPDCELPANHDDVCVPLDAFGDTPEPPPSTQRRVDVSDDDLSELRPPPQVSMIVDPATGRDERASATPEGGELDDLLARADQQARTIRTHELREDSDGKLIADLASALRSQRDHAKEWPIERIAEYVHLADELGSDVQRLEQELAEARQSEPHGEVLARPTTADHWALDGQSWLGCWVPDTKPGTEVLVVRAQEKTE